MSETEKPSLTRKVEDAKTLVATLYRLQTEKGRGIEPLLPSLATHLGWDAPRMKGAVELASGLYNWVESIGSDPEYGGAAVRLLAPGAREARDWADDHELKATRATDANPKETRVMTPQEQRRKAADAGKVFVITGRNNEATTEMTTFLKFCGLDVQTFEQTRTKMGGNATIAEVVRRGMEQALIIIALITPDEWSVLRPDKRIAVDERRPHWKERWQARPNVIFEAGMAWGIDAEYLAIVVLGDAELWTDVDGVHVFRMNDDSTGPRGGPRGDLYDWLKNHSSAVKDTREWMTAGKFGPTLLPEVSTRDPFSKT